MINVGMLFVDNFEWPKHFNTLLYELQKSNLFCIISVVYDIICYDFFNPKHFLL